MISVRTLHSGSSFFQWLYVRPSSPGAMLSNFLSLRATSPHANGPVGTDCRSVGVYNSVSQDDGAQTLRKCVSTSPTGIVHDVPSPCTMSRTARRRFCRYRVWIPWSLGVIGVDRFGFGHRPLDSWWKLHDDSGLRRHLVYHRHEFRPVRLRARRSGQVVCPLIENDVQRSRVVRFQDLLQAGPVRLRRDVLHFVPVSLAGVLGGRGALWLGERSRAPQFRARYQYPIPLVQRRFPVWCCRVAGWRWGHGGRIHDTRRSVVAPQSEPKVSVGWRWRCPFSCWLRWRLLRGRRRWRGRSIYGDRRYPGVAASHRPGRAGLSGRWSGEGHR